MIVLLWSLIGIFLILIFLLLLKIRLMQKSADEIRKAFMDRLENDTNTLIDISSRDASLCALAESINEELKKLRSKRLRFEEGDLAVKEAITNVSHDLRTPLTAIYGYLDLLENEEKSKEAERFLAIIKDRVDVLRQLTQELFCYSAVTSKVWEESSEEIVLNHVLEETILAHYAVLKKCHITPEISMPDKKIIQTLNKSSFIRILENIIGNAAKYSDRDLKITLSPDGEIVFSNHAPSLNEVSVLKLFDRLYTVETGKQSTGLGLSIAKKLTEQMNGQITARYKEETLFIHLKF